MKPNTRIFFLANSCHICKSLHPTVPCEICHMIAYCSPEHRRENWQAHSHLCRALFKLSQRQGIAHIYENARGSSSEQFRVQRHITARDCQSFLERPLEGWELEILYYPKMCGACYGMYPLDLKPCPDCEFVFTCSANHFAKSHPQWCLTLKTYHEIIRYLKYGQAPLVPEIPIKTQPASMADILNTLKGVEANRVQLSFTSELLTYPLTVFNIMSSVSNKDTLTLHIIGAELQAEVLPFWKWETFLLHLIPNCQTLQVVFIGPDLQELEEEPERGHIRVCPECRDTGRKIEYKLVPGTLYHDYCQQNGASKPDLVVALNNGLYRSVGFKDIDSWKPTLDKLFEPKSPPVLITEYTLYEITQDADILQQRFPQMKTIKPPQINPFASTKPSLNVISDEEVPVIFKNYFYMLLGTS